MTRRVERGIQIKLKPRADRTNLTTTYSSNNVTKTEMNSWEVECVVRGKQPAATTTTRVRGQRRPQKAVFARPAAPDHSKLWHSLCWFIKLDSCYHANDLFPSVIVSSRQLYHKWSLCEFLARPGDAKWANLSVTSPFMQPKYAFLCLIISPKLVTFISFCSRV